MNSLLNQNQEVSSGTPENYLLGFEQKLLSLSLLEAELVMKKLKFLGIHFDPFNQEITTECQQIMDDLGLTNHLKNPYLATNILLRLLDKTEEQINNLKQ